MALPNPDELIHQNPNKALVDINSLRGAGCVVDFIGLTSIGIDKRKFGFSAQVGLDRYVYKSADLTNVAWENLANWQIDKDVFVKKDLSNMTAQQIADFKTGLAIDTDDVEGLEALIMTGIKLVEPVIDIVSTLPLTGNIEGDRYIDTSYNEIFTFVNGFFTTSGTPTEGTTVWVIDNLVAPANDKGWYRFNGTQWIYIGKPYKHSELIDKLGNGEYHMSLAEWTAITGGMTSDADSYHTHGSLAKRDGSNIDDSNRLLLNNVLKKTISTVTNYYVELTGNDSNDGLTVGTAFASLAKVFEKVSNTYISNFVNINFGIGSFTIDTDVFAKNSTSIDINTTANNRQFNIIGAMTQIHSGVVVTNIAGRANIRSFSGITVVADALKGKFLKVGTEYFPIAGNTTTEIYVSMSAPAGTYSIFEAQTDLVFTKASFLRKKVDAIMCFKNLNLKFTTPNTILRPQNFGYLFDELNIYFSIGLGAQPFNEALRFVKCGFIRTGLAEVQFGAAINVTDCNYIDGMRLAKNSKMNKFIGGCIFHNNGLGDMVGNNVVSSESGSVLSFINTSGSYNGLFYNIGSCTQACLTIETKGSIKFTQLGETTYGTFANKSFNVILKRFSDLHPLDIVLPNQVTYPMVDLAQGRILMIEGVSKSFNPVLSFETIAEINTLGLLYDFISCTETGKIYKYITLGSAYVVDNISVLATADGGDTRFVNIIEVDGAANGLNIESNTIKLGGSLSENTTINMNSRTLSYTNTSELLIQAPNGVYQVNYRFNPTGITFQNNSALGLSTFTTTDQKIESSVFNIANARFTNFRVVDNKAEFTGKPETTQGIIYGADYSANYIDRSLVDKEYVDTSIAEIPVSYAPDYNTRVINIGAAQEFVDVATAQIYLDANHHLMNLEITLDAAYDDENNDDFLNISNRDEILVHWNGISTGVNISDVRKFSIDSANIANDIDDIWLDSVKEISILGVNTRGIKINTSDNVLINYNTLIDSMNLQHVGYAELFNEIVDITLKNTNVYLNAPLPSLNNISCQGVNTLMTLDGTTDIVSGKVHYIQSGAGVVGTLDVSTVNYSENNKITKKAEIPTTSGALLQDVIGALPDGFITKGILFTPNNPNINFGSLVIKGWAGSSWFTMGTFTYQAGATRYIAMFYDLAFGANYSTTVRQQMTGNYNNNETISDIRLEATNFGGNGGIIEITSEKL